MTKPSAPSRATCLETMMDIDALIRPLDGASPCGADMMFSAAFDDIQRARRFDDPSLSQGEWVTELKEADWAGVVRRCADLLATRTKDLRLAAWLTEALAKTRGMAGLADGYRLLARLCATYWADVHPLAENGDQEPRIGNLDWLLSRSSRIIRELPLTDSAKGVFSFDDLEAARNLGQAVGCNPHESESLLREARVTQAQFDAARDDTPRTFFGDNLAAARAAQAALTELQRVVDARLGAEGPAFGAAHSALESFVDTLGRFAGHADAVTARSDAPPSTPEGAPPSQSAATGAPAALSGPIRTRAQALAQLRQVAAYFRSTEPHSPIAYLADRAARWGEMPLHQWLRAVLKDDGALRHVEELLGVGHDTPGESGDRQ